MEVGIDMLYWIKHIIRVWYPKLDNCAARLPCLRPLGPLLPSSSSGFFAALRPPFPPLAFLAANSFDPQRVRAATRTRTHGTEET